MLFEPGMIDAFSHALARDVPAIIQPMAVSPIEASYEAVRKPKSERIRSTALVEQAP